MKYPTCPLITGLLFLLVTGPICANQESSLAEALSASELGKYQKEDKYHDRLEVIRKALDRRGKHLESQIAGLDIAQAELILSQIQVISNHALMISRQEEDPEELVHKETKKLEILVRKLSEQVGDLARSVPFADRDNFEKTVESLEQLRDRLLSQLFGRVFKASLEPDWGWLGVSRGSSASPAVAQGRRNALAEMDRFTDEEYEKVQMAQELKKRVEILLQIAAARIDELTRRARERAWEEEEPNPLESYAPFDLLYGYRRALESVMTNIDEKANRRLASDKDIKKSLEEVAASMTALLPQLKDIQDFILSFQDEALAREYAAVLQTSQVAKKGAQYGLGAPTEREPAS